jgi:hypothetical protein
LLYLYQTFYEKEFAMMKKKIIISVSGILLMLFVFSGPALPYSYTAWTGMTGAKTLAVNPFAYGSFSPFKGVSIDTVLALGVTANFDILADLATVNIADPVSYGGSWILPRFDLGGANILGLQIGWDTSVFTLIPQYHLFKENDRFAFEFNLGAKIPFADPLVVGLSAVVAPVLKIVPNLLDLFVEVDPGYTFSSPGTFSLNVVPGICLLWGPNSSNQVCAGLILSNVTGTVSTGFGVWYWHPFSL